MMSARAGVWPQHHGKEEQALTPSNVQERNAAFSALVARRSRLMFRVAYALLRNAHDAEDAVQEVFLKLYRGEAWRQIDDEKAFLARTVWRVAFNRLPAKGRIMEDIADTDLSSAASSPEQNAASADERALLRELIDALPNELREALLLSAIEEMNSREAALVIGVPEGTVRTRLMRAKAELKRRYEANKGDKR